jgi:hypothetical protein
MRMLARQDVSSETTEAVYTALCAELGVEPLDSQLGDGA